MDNLQHITGPLKDLLRICEQNDIDYRIIGSVAMIGAVGRAFRIPKDIDVLIDIQKAHILENDLNILGYQKEYQNMGINIFPKRLTRFRKGQFIIEPRFGRLTTRGFEIDLLLPFPIVSKNLRPRVQLVFTKTMFLSVVYRVGGIKFLGLSKEALYLAMLSTSFVETDDSPQEKKKLDMQTLSVGLSNSNLKKLENENPGLYWGSIPLATSKHKLLLKILFIITKGFKSILL